MRARTKGLFFNLRRLAYNTPGFHRHNPIILRMVSSMRSAWLTHKNHRYFHCNYSHLDLEQLKAEIGAVDAHIAQQPAGSVLILTDVRGLSGSPQVVDLFKKSTVRTKPYIRKSCVIGIALTGPKKVLFDLVMKFSGQSVTIFEDAERAKDWLVQS